MYLRTSVVFIIYGILMTGGFIFSTFYTEAPYLAFASQFTIGFGVYVTKRLIQKKGEYNGYQNYDQSSYAGFDYEK